MEIPHCALITVYRHSLSHVMTLAVKRLFGDAIVLGIGPAIDDGFYQDFDHSFSSSDLSEIEDEMHRIIASDYPFVRSEKPIGEALASYQAAGQRYKAEILLKLQQDLQISTPFSPQRVSFYQVDSHKDLCRGPHVASTGCLQSLTFRLDRIAGAYWRGDERNPMLTRIYGLAYLDQAELNQHLVRREQARARDHRALGEKLELFFFHETAPGMAYWLPKGLKIKNLLIQYWRSYHEERGYLEVAAPLLNKQELWSISGHAEHYKSDMVSADLGDGNSWALKPMNCANAMIIWKSKLRSYRDLPLRLSDTDLLHRNEASGSLHGLMRSRCFCQDDSHNFVAVDQIESEIKEILDIVKDFYGVFALLDNVKLYLSTRPVSFLGTVEEWDRAEALLLKVLMNSGINHGVKDGDGAFYAPKIDIHLTDCLGREWQCGTIQVDYQLPRRFGISYRAQDGSHQIPVVIHRVIYGSIERFLGILIEHTGGDMPFWIAPLQLKVILLGNNSEYHRSVLENLDQIHLERPLRFNKLRYEIDRRNESLKRKIKECELQKIPLVVLVGDQEAQDRVVTIRQRSTNKQRTVKLENLEDFLVQVS